MDHKEIRKKFIDFFEKNNHTTKKPASLIPVDDASVLFTTAGMQQFKNYYMDPDLTSYKNVITIQPCIRTTDIDEIGDDTHNTFFEMLGNFSFGGYFKKEAIKLAYELLTKIYRINLENIYVTVFPGDKKIELDSESIRICRELGISDKKIKMGSKKDNFWGPTGNEGPCGPTLEFYYRRGKTEIEIWNLVFNEYYCGKNGKLSSLKIPGVDTGMGLERIVAVLQKKKNIYETDLFQPLITIVKSKIPDIKTQRIVVDHFRASTFLIGEGIIPSNKDQGYILRRLLRRIFTHLYLYKVDEVMISKLLAGVIAVYNDIYPELQKKQDIISDVISKERIKFEKTLNNGLRELNKVEENVISGQVAFKLFDTYGLPIELTKEISKSKEKTVDTQGYDELFKKHQEKSKTYEKGIFKGGLAGDGKKEVKYHTATHLLQAALRHVLGNNVFQKGSNITDQRLRFDFNYPQKLFPEQIKEIEDLVNQKINEGLPVSVLEMNLEQAKLQGALGVFEGKYKEKVKVYSIGDFSKEICGGPHVDNSGEIGNFKIIKEESSSSGTRRIKAVIK